MSVVRLAISPFYWKHHAATDVNVDHYTLHASTARSSGRVGGVAPLTLPDGFYCMVKRLGDHKWLWRIAHLYGYTPELKGTTSDRVRAMTDAESATRKILALAPTPVVGVAVPQTKERAKPAHKDSKTNGVG